MKKRILSILLMCCMVLTLLPTAVFAEGETDVSINETNFPDANFRTVVKEYDTDKDENLSRAEIEAVKEIKCYYKDIRSLTGIEYFTALQTLKCYSNQLTSLDISGNTALKSLDCAKNQLAALDVSQNTALESLDCADNQLTTLDVSRNTALKSLDCAKNQLTTLDVSRNTALESLNCADNQVTSLDISQNTALEYLICASNKLTALNVSGNATLKFLNCESNELTALDVNRNTALNTLNCLNNRLTSLNVSLNLNLQDLNCARNQLSALDVQKNTALKSLYCGYNQLAVLDVGQNGLLESLSCNNNLLTSLNVSQNTRLNLLHCFNNHLTSLDTSNQRWLHTLSCNNNNYPITITNDRNYDLSDLPGTFDVNKASNWSGGTVSGNILTVDHDKDGVTYTYDCGNGKTANFTLTVENKVEEQFTLTPGGRYYFDLSAMNIPGTANRDLPDSTLHYVPFTYVGTVNAYSLENEADKDTTSYEHSLFIANYNVTHTVSWDALNTAGLLFGKDYAGGGVDYTLRAPSVGSNSTGSGDSQRGVPQSNEWDTMLNKNSGYIQNWNAMYSWGQDAYSTSYRAVRGYYLARYWYDHTATYSGSDVGFRPVLELPTDLAADNLKVVELRTVKFMPGEQQNWINIIVKNGKSFKAPAAEGLPRPDGISADTPMWWVDENGNFYKPGDTVPADVSMLSAFYGGLGLFLDRGDGEVEVTPDNYTDIFGDGTASFVLPKGKTLTSLEESYNLTSKDILEIYSTGKTEKYGSVFPNLKLKNADLTSVRLSEKYIGRENPLFITLDGKNTIGSLNRISMSRNTLSVLGDGSLTLNSALTLSQYTQYGGSSVTMTDGLTAYYLSIDSGSLTVTGDPQAITLRDQDISDLYMGDGMRLFTGSSAQDAAEAVIPQLSAEMQEVYQRYLAEDNTLTNEEFTALSNALKERFNAIFRQLPGKTYVRITGAWDVTYKPGENGNGNAVTDIKFYNDALTLRGKMFTRTGYTQVGWATVDGGEKVYGLDAVYTQNEALTLYPVWQTDTYAITYDLNGGTAEGNPDTYTVETDAFTLKNPTRPGYIFTGWSGTGLTGDNNLTVTIPKGSTGNRSYTAHWRYNGGGSSGYSYYTIKATAGTGGSISPSGNVSVREGRDQTFTITPDKGYAVANVKIDGKSIGAVKSYTFENVRRTHTIEVIFMKANGNPQTGVFVDVATGSYYEDAVDWAVENGITKGTDDTHFSPDGICTRAQAVTFLWRTAGSPKPETRTMPFTDVPAGSYYYDAVLWAVENGITEGTSDTTFSPNSTCTRAQIVAFLWRSEKSPAAGSRNPFADVKSTAYYADAVLWAVENDITKGTTNTTFSPNADCTRAQIVTFLWRCKK